MKALGGATVPLVETGIAVLGASLAAALWDLLVDGCVLKRPPGGHAAQFALAGFAVGAAVLTLALATATAAGLISLVL